MGPTLLQETAVSKQVQRGHIKTQAGVCCVPPEMQVGAGGGGRASEPGELWGEGRRIENRPLGCCAAEVQSPLAQPEAHLRECTLARKVTRRDVALCQQLLGEETAPSCPRARRAYMSATTCP